MAENKNKTFGVRKSSGTKNTNLNKASSRDLLSREEEYKRLNEELEAKTASLVKEAETVISEQNETFSRHSLLDKIDTDDLYEYDEDQDNDVGEYEERDPAPSLPPSRASAKVNNQSRQQLSSRGNQSHSARSTASSRPQSGRAKKAGSTRPKQKSKSNLSEDVAVPDEAFTTDFSLQKTISHLEDRVEAIGLHDDDDDVMPSAAAEMGAEAQIRFLKAKLRVMQEELDRLSAECNNKEEQTSKLSTKLKEVEEERSRYQRSSAAQQAQIDKYKRLSEDAKSKADSLENQLIGVRKELESIKRTQKQQASSHSATEVRLNRALEEVEKYKVQLSKTKTDSKDTVYGEKKRVDQLLADNKRLEKQKNELMTGFKKQLKLIDILKRQKMHIEAAKLLSFTEEEFVKALEWSH